jgi:protoheme IX farnesyltransferase
MEAAMNPTDLTLSRRATVDWRSYYEITKPKVVMLILFTALVGMLLATDGMVPLPILFAGMAGIGLAAASGAALNHLVEQRTDAVMQRTRRRPLPSGRLDALSALLFAVALGALSMVLLLVWVNPLTALLTLLSLIGYALIYTLFLKRSSPQSIVWGGLAGAAPPLLGWAAVSGDIHPHALLLVLIVFTWTPPHFWPLAIHRRADYARAGLPMLPVTHGVAYTKQQILLYSVALLAVTMLPYATHMTGLFYLLGALPLGLGFVWHALRLYRSEGDRYAMPMFRYSIVYLAALFTLLLTDHYLPY